MIMVGSFQLKYAIPVPGTPGVSLQASSAGSALPVAAQDAIGHLGSEGMLPTHVQLGVYWDSQILFWRATF